MSAVDVLFYDDSPVFGGHEVTVLHVLRYLLDQTDLNMAFVYYRGNARHSAELAKLAADSDRLALCPVAVRSPRRSPGLLWYLTPWKIAAMRHLIERYAPRAIVVVQGHIEISALGLLAAKATGRRTISFIPMATTRHGNRLRTWCKNRLRRYFYALPDEFITITAGAARDLAAGGARGAISVVHVGPELSRCPARDRAASRQALGLSAGDYAVGCLGRIQFPHKGQDVLVRALAKHKDRLRDVRLLIVGDGPDEAALWRQVAAAGLVERVTLLPWLSDLSHVYSALDLLAIPSRVEGTPLVMLEAMYYGLPIAAAAVGGIPEVLRADWCFAAGDEGALLATLLHVRASATPAILDEHRALVTRDYNSEQFARRFHEALGVAIACA
jgi:glycosyltransferase involved in cell wall biosynthesis